MFQFIIEGGIGCRKSTLLKRLHKQGLKTVQEPLGEYLHLLEGLFDPKRSFNSQMQIIISLHRHQQKEKFFNKQDIIVYERSISSAYVFIKCMKEFNLLTEEEVTTLNNTIDILIDPHDHFEKIFFLRSSVEKSMELIKTRSRKGEHLITKKYLNTLSRLYNEYLSNLENVMIIDIDPLTNDEITYIIHSTINQSLPVGRAKLPFWHNSLGTWNLEPWKLSKGTKNLQVNVPNPFRKWPPTTPAVKATNKSLHSRFSQMNYEKINQSKYYPLHDLFGTGLKNTSSSSSIDSFTSISNSNSTRTVKIDKVHPMAEIPKRFYENDSGWDLSIPLDYTISPNSIQKLRTGLKLTFPKSLYGIIHNRSSWPKFGLIIIIGILDNCFTGEVYIQAHNISNIPIHLYAGDRIAQLIFHPVQEIQFTGNSMIQSNPNLKKRGEKAFGSTDYRKRDKTKQEEFTNNSGDLTKDFENLQLNLVWREWNRLEEEEDKMIEEEEKEEKEEEEEEKMERYQRNKKEKENNEKELLSLGTRKEHTQ